MGHRAQPESKQRGLATIGNGAVGWTVIARVLPRGWAQSMEAPWGGGTAAAAAVRMKQRSSAFYWISKQRCCPSQR